MNDALFNDLTTILGDDSVSTRSSDREAASRDESDLPAHLPDVVVWCDTTETIRDVVLACRTHNTPLTVRAAGSSLEGNPIPTRGGVVMDITRMTKVLEVRPEDLVARVQPGIVYDHLNDKLRAHGLFFAPSPGGSGDVATVGGMVANNASGIYALKYGATERHILGLKVVTGAGEIIDTGHACPKTSSGYDLTALMCGSEGTLGIITEVVLSLTGRPAHTRKLAMTFESETACATAIATMIGYGVDLAACEYLDRCSIRALNEFKDYGLPEQATLLMEVHAGSDASLDDIVEIVQSVCVDEGGATLDLPEDPWVVRHWATRAVRAVRRDTQTIRCDVAFPISALPQVVDHAHRLGERDSLSLYAFGHVGLGILHVLIQEDPQDEAAWQRAHDAKDELVAAVIDGGGTCSGEHGIGLGNRRYMTHEHGPALAVMQRIKHALDPDGILNPGKIFPDTD
jgi:D-lactate dehydrogenase (cytochrome)